MSSGEVNILSPLNRTGANEGASNTAQPSVSSQPVTSTARTANTQPSGLSSAPPGPTRVPAVANRVPPGPTRVPAPANRPPGPARPPASRPVGPTRTPGPVRGTPRPNTRPGTTPLAYKIRRVSALRRYCVPVTTVILILASLAVIGILIKVVLDNYYFFCTKSFKFIPLDKWCDGTQDCNGNEDELRCVQHVDYSNRSIVRLTESRSLVQLSSSGTWYYVCFDGFDATRAKAVCAQLGYSSNPTFTFVSATNGPFSTIYLDGSGGFTVTPTNGACSSGNIVSLSCITCGANHNKERIIGGQDTSIESSAWQVSLQYMGQHSCGGSILTPRIILSAAHCFQKNEQQVDRWRVQAGRSSLSYVFASQVDKIFVPTLYSLDGKLYDIAILKLKSDLTLSDSIQPVCLPGFDINLPNNTPLTVTGWGHTVEGGSSLASTLQKVSINLVSNDICNQEYFNQIQNTMMCAGRLSGGADTCQGDSGGPLVYLGDKSWEQVGVVSWGDGCGRPGKVGVYTKVSSFLSWIYSIMQAEL
ncbi:transmembrane protease serine 4 isoform X2 [Hyla sarda]|uniref:transmembrane protease serine 4 isoform X2 n=1 Tax=Hyla sarda TaxID=327740 RepID=UPI0024C3A9AB|nr:transmembrane protease serine 4 isoform X2 [Hyla sarda]